MAVSKASGGNGYSRTANLPSITLWSVLGWLYLDSITDTAICYFGGNPSGNRYALEYSTADDAFNIANTDANFPGTNGISAATWYHIALVCSGSGAGQLLMYLDGQLEITADGRAANVAGILRLGLDETGTGFAGDMEHWKVFDAALTQAEVQAEMACKYPRKPTGLNGYYRLDDTVTDNSDFSNQGRSLTTVGTVSNGGTGPTFTGIQVERVTPKATVNTGTATATFIGTPQIGNRIVISGENWSGGAGGDLPLANDTSANAYSYDGSRRDLNDEGFAFVASAPITATSSGLQVTLSTDVIDSTKTFAAAEVSGLAASPVDKAVSAQDGTTPYEVATGALAQADEIVFGAFIFIGVADQDEGIDLTSWGGLNPVTLFNEDGPGIVGEFGAGGFAYTSSTSSVTVGFLNTVTASQPAAVVAVTYKAAAGDFQGPWSSPSTRTSRPRPVDIQHLADDDGGRFNELDVRNWL